MIAAARSSTAGSKFTKEQIPKSTRIRCSGIIKNSLTPRCVRSWSKKASPTFMCAALPMMFASVSICMVQATCELRTILKHSRWLFLLPRPLIRRYRTRLAISGLPNHLDWRLLSWRRRYRHRSDQRRHSIKSRRDCSVERGMSHRNRKRGRNICCASALPHFNGWDMIYI